MFLLPLALTIFGSSMLSPVSERFSGRTAAGVSSFFAFGGVFLAGFVSIGATGAVATASEAAAVASFAADLAALGFLSGASVFFLDSAMIKLFRLWLPCSESRQPFCADPCACGRWYLYVGPAPAIRGDVEFLDSN